MTNRELFWLIGWLLAVATFVTYCWISMRAISTGSLLDVRLVSEDTWGILTVYQEAAGEPFEGKVAVAEVIRRRAATKYQSDGTIAGTVLKALQFSGWNAKDPSRIPSAKLDDDTPTVKECMKAWYDAATTSLTKDALLYYNPRLAKPSWNFDELEFVVTIGQHDFYRVKT